MKKRALIIILLILMVGVLIFGCFKYLNGKNNNSNDETIDTIAGERIEFPQEFDDNILIGELSELLEGEEKSNFKDLKKEKNGNTFIFDCISYDEKDSKCLGINVNVNNELYLNYLYTYNGFYKKFNFYKVNDYYVIIKYTIENESVEINIYNNSSQVVYSNYLVHPYYWLNNKSINTNDDMVKVEPVIKDGILHFVEEHIYELNSEIKNSNSALQNSKKLRYNIINLNKKEIEVNLVKEFNGYYNLIPVVKAD